MSLTMQHCNGNVIAAVQLVTSGPLPGYNELLEVCIMLLDSDLKPLGPVFNAIMRPFHPERIETEWYKKKAYVDLQKKLAHAVDSFTAADAFDRWFDGLGLRVQKWSGESKRIIPLFYAKNRELEFLKEWLQPGGFARCFSDQFRDVYSNVLFLNDKASFDAVDTVPFPKHNLTYIANKLCIESEYHRFPLQRCKIIAEIYRQLCMRRFTR